MSRKILSGIFIHQKSSRTASVVIKKIIKHKIYKKIIIRLKKYLVHNEYNHIKMGDIITIVENKPLSKKKHWVVIDKI